MLLEYAMEQDWEIFHIYVDDDYAGADRKRPAFNSLLRDAQNHKFDIILCKTQSRFTRELELVEKYIHGLFPLWGVRFVSIVDNADTANKGNKKSRQINGLVNEWYLEDMSENIRSVLTNKRKNGFHIGAFAPYGYKKDPAQKGHLIVDEEAALVVREVFTLFSQGYGKTAIARMLNDRGVPNPTEYKRLKGLRYQQPDKEISTLWKYFSIANLLNNEVYIGNMVQGKYGSMSYKTKQNKPRPKDQWYRVEETHEPIIDPDLWSTVEGMMKQRTKPFAVGTIGLFAKKTRCANCGYIMRSSKSRNKHYLKCSSRHIAKDACIGSFLSVEQLEQAVIKELNRLSFEYLDPDKLEENIKFSNQYNQQKERIKGDLAAYQKRITDYEKSIRELYIDKVKGILSESEYVTFSKEFTAEKEHLEGAFIDGQKQLTEIEKKMQFGENHQQIIAEYIHLKKLNRETVVKFIDYISIHKRIPHTRDVPIEIHWNF